MRRWPYGLLALIGVGILLELGLRFGVGLGDPPLVSRDPEVEYRLLPSSEYSRFGNRIYINRYGMRAPEHAPTKSEGERRVLIVGDSVVYGNHFLDQAETIAVQLVADLAPMLSCATVAMPAAASSWGPVNQAAFLQDIGHLDTDMAVFVVSSHDLYDTPTFQDAVIPYRLQPSFGALHDAVVAVLERLKRRANPDRPVEPIAERQRKTLLALDQMSAQLSREGIPVVLVYHPTVSELSAGVSQQQQIFFAWAAEKGYPTAALTTDLTAQDYRDSIHPNASGAAKIASRLSEIAQDTLSECSKP